MIDNNDAVELSPSYIKRKLLELPEELSVARRCITDTKITQKKAEYKYRQHRSKRRMVYKVLHPEYTVRDLDATVDNEPMVQQLWLDWIDAQASHEYAKTELDRLEDEFISIRKLASLLETELKSLGG
jgi:hypothetical protein